MADDYKFLKTEEMGEVCRVLIRRPDDRNSINSELMSELHRFLDWVEKSTFRVVAFSGWGRTYFVGGADGVEMMTLDRAGAEGFSRRIQGLFDRLEACPLLTVAVINGLCFGGGYEFALACDLRVAAVEARIGLPEVKVGLIPGGGGTQRLAGLVGQGRAMEMILSGRLYKGDEAERLGLVNRAAPADELWAETDRMLDPILRRPQYALSLAKRAVKASAAGGLSQGLPAESELFGRCFNESFFKDLMREQLREGILKTTADVSSLLGKES